MHEPSPLRKIYRQSNERGSMKYLLFIVLLVAVVITAGCVGGNQNSAVTPTPQIVYVTVLVTPTPTIITPTTPAPTPIITPARMSDTNSQWGSSNDNNLVIRIPVVPATSIGNEPSVEVKAKYSTADYAQSFALSLAKQYGMTQTSVQTTRPLIHAYTSDQDSRLDLTNRDTIPHVYLIEVNFYGGDVQLISNTGQWLNNGYTWYVLPGQTVRAEVIPPENATSYVIKSVAIATRNGFYSTEYDLVPK